MVRKGTRCEWTRKGRVAVGSVDEDFDFDFGWLDKTKTRPDETRRSKWKRGAGSGRPVCTSVVQQRSEPPSWSRGSCGFKRESLERGAGREETTSTAPTTPCSRV